MLEGQSASLFIGLIVTGLALILLVWFLSRLATRLHPVSVEDIARATSGTADGSGDPVLVVEPGGRIREMNPAARTLFALLEGEYPHLERLARRARPDEAFLRLCAAPERGRFSVNGRMVEGTSYRLGGGDPLMVVTLRRVETVPVLAGNARNVSGSVLKVVTEFGQSIAASLDLDATAHAILENVEQLVPADFVELKVWDRARQDFTVFRFSGAMGTDRTLERGGETRFPGLSGPILTSGQPRLVADTSKQTASSSPALPAARSYLGVPLKAGGEVVGLLEVGVLAAEALGDEDRAILELIGGQAGAALRNAVLYAGDQKRTAELAGLADLAQFSSGSITDPAELYGRMVRSLSALFAVEIIGFLSYDEEQRALSGQAPFYGVSSQVVQIYRSKLDSGSAGEQLVTDQKLITSENAAEDPHWVDLGLREFAQAASMRETALVPLIASGRTVGFLQLSNHSEGMRPFDDDELRLANIVSNQAAALVENHNLVVQSRQRAQRSESLRRIAALIGSTATLDETLQFAMQELGSLIHADGGSVFLYDESTGVLRSHLASTFQVPDDVKEVLANVYIDPVQFKYTATGSQRPFISGNLADDRRILPFYRPFIKEMESQSAITVPMVSHARGVGEIMMESRRPDAFTEIDLQVMVTAAGQLATAIDRSQTVTYTDENLRRRADYLVALSRIVREFNLAADVKSLLQAIHDEGQRILQADCGSVLYFDAEKRDASAPPKVLHHAGHYPGDTLPPVERAVFEGGKLLVVDDYEKSDHPAPHKGIRSSLCLPILSQGDVAGLIHLHAKGRARFDQVAVEIAQTLAVQAATAIGNVTRFTEQARHTELLRRRAETLSRFFETAQSLMADQPLEIALDVIGRGIQEVTPFQVVLFSVHEPESGLLRRVTGVGMTPETLEVLKSHQQPWNSVGQLLRPEFKIGEAYFIPWDQTPVVPTDVHIVTVMEAAGAPAGQSPSVWNPDDFLLFPLYEQDGKPLGLLSFDNPRDNLRPDRATIETLEIFAAQAALTISNGRRLSGLKGQVSGISQELERQKDVVEISQQHLPALLHKDLAQTLAVSSLDQRGRRIRAGLEVIQVVSRQLDQSSALNALGSEMLTRFGMTVSLLAEETADGPRVTKTFGSLPRGVNPEAMFGQRNPLRTSLQSGDTILAYDLDEDQVWHDTPLLNALRAKSFISLPIVLENKPVAAVMAASFEPMPPFSPDDRQFYSQIAHQASVALQNLNLLNETRKRLQEVNLLLDFSRRLSGLDPASILNSLLESALTVIAAAHAGVVLVWSNEDKRLIPQAAARYADDESLMGISYRSEEGLPGRVFAERQARRVHEINFTADYNLPAENLLRYRKATAGRLPVSSLVLPIQTAERAIGVIVLDNFNTAGAFRAEDEALLSSLTQQVALSLENVRLVQTTQERAAQLEALNEAAAMFSTSLQGGQLVSQLLDQLATIIRYDTGILWLRNEAKVVVSAARGFADNEQRQGLTVALEDSLLLKEMITTGRPLAVADVRQDPRFPSLVDPSHLSWLGIPLISKGEVTGVIALEKVEANYFTPELVQLVSTFASQAAVALDNAALFEESLRRAAELDERSQRLARLNQFSAGLGGSLNTDQVLRLTGEELRKALNASRVAVLAFETEERVQLQNMLPDELDTPPLYRTMPLVPLFDRLREAMGIYAANEIAQEAELRPLADLLGESKSLIAMAFGDAGSPQLLLAMTDELHRFTPAEIELSRAFTNQATIALQNAQLYQSTLQTAERLATLNQASYEIGASLNPEDTYKAIHTAVEKLMPMDAFVITLMDEDAGEIDGTYVVDMGQRITGIRIPVGQGLSGRMIETGESLLTLDSAEADERGAISVGEADAPHSIVAVPISSGGNTIGMLSAQSYQFDAYTQSDLQILSTLANQASIAIQNGRLFAETQSLAATLEQRVVERTAQLQHEQRNTETLLRILSEVSASLDLDRALGRTLALLNEAIGAEQGTIMLLSPEDNLLHFRAGYGYASASQDAAPRKLTLRVGEGLAGWVVKNRQPALVRDLAEDPRWVPSTTSSTQHRCAVVAPLLVGEDVIGAIMVFHRQAAFFSEDALGMVQAIGGQVAISINNAQLYELIRDQAERLGAMLRNQQVESSRQTAILESVADGVLVTNPRNEIDFLNRSANQILQIEENDVLGKPLESFAGLFGRATQTWIETIRSWSENPSAHQVGDNYAEQITLEDGRVVLVNLAPVIWQREFLGTVSIFRDITHEVEVDRLKSEFVATVSHELRTPMTSIRGYVDILLMGAAGALSDNQRHFLDIVKGNTDRLNILVNDLLDISSIESGRLTLSMQAVDLREVADEIAAELRRRSEEEHKPMAVTVKAGKKLPRAHGDVDRLRQVLRNLADNAYSYSHPHGKITIQLRAHNGEVEVDVRDTGVGVPLEAQERVFERFYRGEDPLVFATPGTGLGLSIVRQIVELHRGRIWMNSSGISGQGSTFSFTVPTYQSQEETS
jgi:PAS domain S-box-containing protein